MTSRGTGTRGAERGAATLMVIVTVAVTMAATALVYDLGMAAVSRSEIADAASTLARVGAQELIRDSSGEQFGEDAALDLIEELANERWPSFTWTADIGIDEVTVTVTGRYDARLMDAFGWAGADVEVAHTSNAQR